MLEDAYRNTLDEMDSLGESSRMAAMATATLGEDMEGMTSEAICAMAVAAAPQTRLLRHPSLRRIYLIAYLLTTLIIFLPLWTLFYLPRRNRPRQTWTIGRCLRVRWSRALCAVVAQCEMDSLGRDLSVEMDPLALKHSHPIMVPSAPDFYLRGHPAETLAHLHDNRGRWIPHFLHRLNRHAKGAWGAWNPQHVESEAKTYGFSPVSAFWFTGEKGSPAEGPRPRLPGQAVMLHFHGGGYLCGTAAETDLTSSIPKRLIEISPVQHILSVDYRLAPSAPWPLPLLDAISAYHHLVHREHVPERDIFVVGDSAGGHLALALTRYLRDEGRAVGLEGPRGVVVLSPWVDVGFTNAWTPEGRRHNADSDTLDDTFGPFATSLLTRALPASAMHTSPYLSPAGLLIPTTPTGPDSMYRFPPTYIVYGDAERLSASIRTLWARLRLARKAEAISGERLGRLKDMDRIVGVRNAVHDFAIFPWMKDEAEEMYTGLVAWLEELLENGLLGEEIASVGTESDEETEVGEAEVESEGTDDTAVEDGCGTLDEGKKLDLVRNPTPDNRPGQSDEETDQKVGLQVEE